MSRTTLREELEVWKDATWKRYGGVWSARVVVYAGGPFVRVSWSGSASYSEVPLDDRGRPPMSWLNNAAASIVGAKLRADIAQGEAMAAFIIRIDDRS